MSNCIDRLLQVNEKLSKPNIFILNNRWDASADDEPDTIQLVRQQHQQRATEFLVEDLKCVAREDASDRIYFVSALETLRHRIAEKKKIASGTQPLRQASIDDSGGDDFELGKIQRRQEFEEFELKFKECISKSAIVTKFNGHTVTGLHIAEEMTRVMEQVLARASSQVCGYRYIVVVDWPQCLRYSWYGGVPNVCLLPAWVGKGG